MDSKQKTSNDVTMRQKRMMRELFNEVILSEDITREAWKRVQTKVKNKKGDVDRT